MDKDKSLKLFVDSKVRAIFYNEDNRFYLERRQYYIAKKLISYIGESGSVKKTELLDRIIEEFNKAIKIIYKKYDNPKLLPSQYKWIIKHKNKSKEYRYNKLSRSNCKLVLQMLVPIFVKCFEKPVKNSKHTSQIYSLNGRGKEVYEKIMDEEVRLQNGN